jgi:hypothetical protein
MTVGTKRAQSNTPSPKLQNKKTHDTDNTSNVIITFDADAALDTALVTHVTNDSGEARESYKVQSLQRYPNIMDVLRKAQRGVRFSIITETPYPMTPGQKDDIVSSKYTIAKGSTLQFEIGESLLHYEIPCVLTYINRPGIRQV